MPEHEFNKLIECVKSFKGTYIKKFKYFNNIKGVYVLGFDDSKCCIL